MIRVPCCPQESFWSDYCISLEDYLIGKNEDRFFAGCFNVCSLNVINALSRYELAQTYSCFLSTTIIAPILHWLLKIPFHKIGLSITVLNSSLMAGTRPFVLKRCTVAAFGKTFTTITFVFSVRALPAFNS